MANYKLTHSPIRSNNAPSHPVLDYPRSAQWEPLETGQLSSRLRGQYGGQADTEDKNQDLFIVKQVGSPATSARGFRASAGQLVFVDESAKGKIQWSFASHTDRIPPETIVNLDAVPGRKGCTSFRWSPIRSPLPLLLLLTQETLGVQKPRLTPRAVTSAAGRERHPQAPHVGDGRREHDVSQVVL